MAAKPGERRLQILQTLAEMLETPEGEKITTAALAARVGVSEAALYRHFASKAKMFEALIEFVESSLLSVFNQISADHEDGLTQVEHMLNLLLGFAQKNRGLSRVLIGEALVNENARLQARVNKLLDRVESSLKQSLRVAQTQGKASCDPKACANLLTALVLGRWQQYAKSGFTREPLTHWPEQWAQLLRSI